MFSYLICLVVMKNDARLSEELYGFMLGAPTSGDKSKYLAFNSQEALHGFLTEQQWDAANTLQQRLPDHFSGLASCLLLRKEEWQAFMQAKESNDAFEGIPAPFQQQPRFVQLLIVELLKPQAFVRAVRQFVKLELGSEFARSPPTSMEVLFQGADNVTPIIFVLSQGADPTDQITHYARKKQVSARLYIRSLGQGQEAVAKTLIVTGMERGYWVVLQNCHLFRSWMPQLQALCSSFPGLRDSIHRDFRLILTSQPVDFFPASVLQHGLKITTEPPAGLKANLQRTFADLIDKDLFGLAEDFQLKTAAQAEALRQKRDALVTQASGRTEQALSLDEVFPTGRPSLRPGFERNFKLPECWRALLLGLGFFHAVVQERKKFGPLGWNISYEFNDSDLDSSIRMVESFLFESEHIQWDAMTYMIGHINYGGRVTDDVDRLLLIALLKSCYGPHLLEPSMDQGEAPRKMPTNLSNFWKHMKHKAEKM